MTSSYHHIPIVMGQQKLQEMHPLIYQERKPVIEQLAVNLMEGMRDG